MQTYFILTVLGKDRPGLVRNLSDVLERHQGNWMESRMVNLANTFAGVLQVSLPEQQVTQFQQAIELLQRDGWQIQLEQHQGRLTEQPATKNTLDLELLGPDHPGIIHNITTSLATLNVNIEELLTEQRAAPMSNEALFFARLTLGLPQGMTADEVQDALEALSDQLMVDIQFNQPAETL